MPYARALRAVNTGGKRQDALYKVKAVILLAIVPVGENMET
jgi:hypothetical protein